VRACRRSRRIQPWLPALLLTFGGLSLAFSQLLLVMGSDKRPRDVDHNGLDDAWERRYFGALGQNPAADSDGDGLTNAQEAQAGAHPLAADSDGDTIADGRDPSLRAALDTDADGLPDEWELFWFGTLTYGAAGDPDGDGQDNAAEYRRGTDPTRGEVTGATLKLEVFTP
jgi:hypothetical protein